MNEALKKIKEAIIKYEETRQEVCRLKRKRSLLLEQCNLFDFHGEKICLEIAYSEFEVDQYCYNSKVQFLEFLESMRNIGECCNRCLDSYRIKAVELPKANQNHGIAKSNITRLGKRLMTCDSDDTKGSLNQIDNANSAEYQLSIMQNIEREIPKAVRRRTQNWSLVKDYLLGQTSKGGSTSCYRHCQFLGVDPEGFSFYDKK